MGACNICSEVNSVELLRQDPVEGAFQFPINCEVFQLTGEKLHCFPTIMIAKY